MKKKDNSPDTEKRLRSYQKATLFLFYPFLLDFMSNALGSFVEDYDFCLSFASTRSLMLFFRDTSLSGSVSFSLFLGNAISFLLLLFSIFLTLKAAKGKRYPLFIALSLFLLDFFYNAFLYLPSISFHMSLFSYILSLSMHAVFVFLASHLLWKYDKLSGLLKEERKEGKN